MLALLRSSALALVPVALSLTCGHVESAPPCSVHPGVVIVCAEGKACPEGYICDFGYCFEPTQQMCLTDADCTTKGTTCLLYADVCVVGGAACTSDADCTSDQVCDSGGVCIATRRCAKDADCGSGELCGQGGICVLDCGD